LSEFICGYEPYYRDIAGSIYCGDCLDIMKGIPDGSVDMVFTSPPFQDKDVNGDYWIQYDKWFREMKRVCSKVIITIHSATKINYLMSQYPPKRLMIWGQSFSKYAYRFKPILVYQQDETYSVNKRIWSDCFAVRSLMEQQKEKKHKYQDPPKLYLALLQMFKECNLILDPFLGSGTTAFACKQLSRRYIGIEINPKDCEIAKEKLSQEVLVLV
jgi:DNA modification methylase